MYMYVVEAMIKVKCLFLRLLVFPIHRIGSSALIIYLLDPKLGSIVLDFRHENW